MSAARGPGGRLLVVDDDEQLRRLMAEVLQGEGFEVVTAGDGARALGLLARGGFDAVLSDVLMPDMTGLQLLRAARERDLDVPVVLITGSPDVHSAARAVDYGALRYLIKPVSADALGAAAREAVRLHRLARLKRAALEHLGQQERLLGDRAGLEAAFERALASLWLALQPIFDASGPWGNEALLRTEASPLRSPAAVLEAAQRLGRMHDLGRVVRDRAAAILDRRDVTGPVSVNLHPQDLDDERLYRDTAPLSRHAGQVLLELTEQAPLAGIADLQPRVGKLRELGYRIAIDDLGAGYAGLGCFVALEPDIVKLDRDLVHGVDRESIKSRLVRSLVEVCHDSGILLVGEGIETPGELHALQDLGCDLFQGYHLGRPARVS